MADIRLSVDKDFIESLKRETGITDASQLTGEALAFYMWALSEVRAGRVLLSTDQQGGDVRKIDFPTLEKVRQNKL
jgi:hypothetical protein